MKKLFIKKIKKFFDHFFAALYFRKYDFLFYIFCLKVNWQAINLFFFLIFLLWKLFRYIPLCNICLCLALRNNFLLKLNVCLIIFSQILENCNFLLNICPQLENQKYLSKCNCMIKFFLQYLGFLLTSLSM